MKVGENMPRKKTHEQFLKELKEAGIDVIVLGKYIDSKTKIKLKCSNPECGCEWEMAPSKIFRKRKHSICPECKKEELRKEQTKTTEQFKKELEEHLGNSVEVIGEYINSKTPIKVRCTNPDCNHEWENTPYLLLTGQGCPKCLRKMQSEMQTKKHGEFMKDFIKRGNSNVIVKGIYINQNTPIKCQCKNNPGHIWEALPKALMQGIGCPFCRGMRVNETNSIRTVRPDLIKFLKDESDADKYTINSNKKIVCKCPNCGTEKEMIISNLSGNGFVCDVCSDGISFPNKIIRNMLQMLEIDFYSEWSPEWAKNFRYDVMFKLNEKTYVCEADGSQHKTKKFNGHDIIINDDEKDKLAKENNCIIIRINCEKSDSNFIIKNIKNSLLGELFNLTDFNWKECIIRSEKNVFIEACNIIKDSPFILSSEIAQKLKISKATVNRYISKGKKLGLIKGREKAVKKGKKVIVFKDNEKIFEYNSIRAFSEHILQDIGEKLSRDQIMSRFKKNNNLFKLGEYKIIQEE